MSEYNPNKLKEQAKQKNILDVANMLGMELKRVGRNYVWTEHKSLTINPEKNYFSWFSKGGELLGQDVIKLVQVVNQVSYPEALKYLLDTEVGTFDYSKIPKKEPFVYKVKEARNFDYARKYLKEVRKLSDETIDLFLSKGLMVQAIHKDYKTQKTEPMIVFKHFDYKGNLAGGYRQGMWKNFDLYPDRGTLKKALFNSDGSSGFILDIGDTNSFRNSTKEEPFVLYVFEAPIDMMSYYELHKDKLKNCRLVAMNGLNKNVISKAAAESLLDLESIEKIKEQVGLVNWLDKMNEICSEGNYTFGKLKIVLAVDNDEPKFDAKLGKVITPGKDFVNSLGWNHIKVIPHMPKCHDGQKKNDWNDELIYQKELKLEKEQAMNLILSKIQDKTESIGLEV